MHCDKAAVARLLAENGSYRYYVGRGNGGDLIRLLLAERPWWQEIAESESSAYNICWGTMGKEYLQHPLPARGQLMNQIKGQSAIVKKDRLAATMRNYAHAVNAEAAATSRRRAADADAPITFDVHAIMPQTFVLEPNWPKVKSNNSFGANSLTGGLRLRRGDVIVGIDGVMLTRGVMQMNEVLDSQPAPHNHVFVVRRKGVDADPDAEAALDALECELVDAVTPVADFSFVNDNIELVKHDRSCKVDCSLQ